MIGDDEPTATGHAFDIADGINTVKQAMALEDFEVRRVRGDLIEGGIAAKRRFFLGQEMDFSEIGENHSINPFRGDYSTAAPRGARGSRMYRDKEPARQCGNTSVPVMGKYKLSYRQHWMKRLPRSVMSKQPLLIMTRYLSE